MKINGETGRTVIILGICFMIIVALWLIGCISQTEDATIRFVAVGSSGVVIYSTDGGKNWAEGTSGATEEYNFFGIAADGNGRWIAVGGGDPDGGIIYISTNGGVTWTAGPTTSGYYFTGVAADGQGNWVIVGRDTSNINGIILYSTNDGVSWNPGGPTSYALYDVATDGNGRWVAVGSNDGFVSDSDVRYSVNNGEDWTAGATGTTYYFNGVATDGSGLWVAVGAGGKNRYSTNGGATWAPGTDVSFDLTDVTLTDVATDGSGRWVSAGIIPGFGTSHYSDNGNTWNPGTPTHPQWLNGVATDDNGNWVVVGEKGSGETGYVACSNDGGVSWTSGSSNITSDLNAVAAGP